MDFTKAVLENKEKMLHSIKQSIKINSVRGDAKEGMPFGEGPKEALENMLNLGESFGFEVQNFDNYIGHIDFGDGEEILGILGHADIVPAGEDWICDPFGGEVIDNKLYGRGVIDDKGPMIVCLYAMKILKDLNVPLSKKVRMIIGADEEVNWECVEHYFNTLKMPMPSIAFTPDAEFPVTFAEKGIIQCFISSEVNEDFSLKGGSAFNSVPEHAEILIDSKYLDSLKGAIEETEKLMDCTCEVIEKSEKVLLNVKGKSAHTARLQGGCNAISCLMNILSKLPLEGELKKISDFYNEKIGLDYYGKNLGIACNDGVSGDLTLNVGLVYQEDNKVVFSVDSRLPVLIDTEEVYGKIEKALEDTDFSAEISSITEPLYVSKDSFLVKTLMDVYRKVTGDMESEPLVDGAATYARACDNCVAFGALLKDQENLMHYKNEHVELEKLDLWLKIYLEAIYNLAK